MPLDKYIGQSLQVEVIDVTEKGLQALYKDHIQCELRFEDMTGETLARCVRRDPLLFIGQDIDVIVYHVMGVRGLRVGQRSLSELEEDQQRDETLERQRRSRAQIPLGTHLLLTSCHIYDFGIMCSEPDLGEVLLVHHFPPPRSSHFDIIESDHIQKLSSTQMNTIQPGQQIEARLIARFRSHALFADFVRYDDRKLFSESQSQ